ncbi:MAG: hypothetical protein KF777_19410 [Planctomycetaceae bacterium]|nr:hypothetical protein [Planctomycetaceae bacterium]
MWALVNILVAGGIAVSLMRLAVSKAMNCRQKDDGSLHLVTRLEFICFAYFFALLASIWWCDNIIGAYPLVGTVVTWSQLLIFQNDALLVKSAMVYPLVHAGTLIGGAIAVAAFVICLRRPAASRMDIAQAALLGIVCWMLHVYVP